MSRKKYEDVKPADGFAEAVEAEVAKNLSQEAKKWLVSLPVSDNHRKEIMTTKLENVFEVGFYKMQHSGFVGDYLKLIQEHGVLLPEQLIIDPRGTEHGGNLTTQLVINMPKENYTAFLAKYKITADLGGDDQDQGKYIKMGDIHPELMFANHAKFPATSFAASVLTGEKITPSVMKEISKNLENTERGAEKLMNVTESDRKLIQETKNELAAMGQRPVAADVEAFVMVARESGQSVKLRGMNPQDLATTIVKSFKAKDSKIGMDKDDCNHVLTTMAAKGLGQFMRKDNIAVMPVGRIAQALPPRGGSVNSLKP